MIMVLIRIICAMLRYHIMKRSLRLTTKQQEYILPWDFSTVCNAICSQKIGAKNLCFKDQREKKQLCRDLFLLAAQGHAQNPNRTDGSELCRSTESLEQSPLALIARKLIS